MRPLLRQFLLGETNNLDLPLILDRQGVAALVEGHARARSHDKLGRMPPSTIRQIGVLKGCGRPKAVNLSRAQKL